MEIVRKNGFNVITPFCPKLDKRTASSLFKHIENEEINVAINMDYVSDCTIEFIEELKNISNNKKIGIFNISSEIFALFNLMNLDKTIPLFVSEIDFEDNQRRLINRRFSVV